MRINDNRNFAMIQNIVGLLPILFILTMFVLHLALPDKTFSQQERRYLAQRPVFRIEEVLNGSYATKVESYFSDQFPFRNFWVDIQEGTDQETMP
ncbi:DHHW family protein [Peptococcaceae bacterium 1198_IL3148]